MYKMSRLVEIEYIVKTKAILLVNLSLSMHIAIEPLIVPSVVILDIQVDNIFILNTSVVPLNKSYVVRASAN